LERAFIKVQRPSSLVSTSRRCSVFVLPGRTQGALTLHRRAELHHHLCDKGFALFHGSTAFRQRASRLAVRSFSLMLKLSSRGAIGSVASRTSMGSPDFVEEADEVDKVLRVLERRRG
jgi:hypothetical protein